jgi:hypothetical protein
MPEGGAKTKAQKQEHGKANVRQSRATIPGDQATVRIDESEVQSVTEEHCARRHSVSAIEPVDGATAVDSDSRTSASQITVTRRKNAPMALNPRQQRLICE